MISHAKDTPYQQTGLGFIDPGFHWCVCVCFPDQKLASAYVDVGSTLRQRRRLKCPEIVMGAKIGACRIPGLRDILTSGSPF